MSSQWGTVIAVVMCALALLGVVWRAAYHDGKIDEAIDRLSRLAEKQGDQILELQKTRR